MAEVKGKRIVVPDASAVTMASRLGRYKPETEQPVRTVEVVEDETLKLLKEAWKVFRHLDLTDGYKNALILVKWLKYSASDIEDFSIALGEFQAEDKFRHKAGNFLSALINSGKNSDYVIRTTHLAVLPDGIGYKNTKNIIVDGDVGDRFGVCMTGGSIAVNGNAGEYCGAEIEDGSITVAGDVGELCGHYMKGGSIAVNGNVGELCGYGMKGGLIRVKGNSGRSCGFWMGGGEIHVEGEIGDIAAGVTPGKIYQRGKRVYG